MVELYEHQRKAVAKLGNGRILWGDVGTGKTLTALAYYVAEQSPRRIIVITTAKKRDSLDWQRDAARFAIGGSDDATAHGLLTVDSWNNIGSYSGVEGAFFIFDEQRIVGAGAWTKAFVQIAKRNTWILCTATPGDTWLDYIPVFVAAGYFKNRTEFLNNHVVFNRFSKFPKVERYTNVGKLVKIRNEMLVEMPWERHTERVTKILETKYDEALFDKVATDRWNVFEQRPLRDVPELFLVMRKVVNSDSSRIRTIRTLMKEHPKLIVFYNHNYELEILRTLADIASSAPIPVPAGTKSSPSCQASSPSSGASAVNEPVRTNSSSATSTTSTTMYSSHRAALSGRHHEPRESESWHDQSAEQPTPQPASTAASTPSTTKTVNDPASASPAISRSSPTSTTTSTTALTSTGISRTTTSSNTPSDAGSIEKPSRSSSDETSPTGSGSGSRTILAEWNGHKHEPIPTSDRWVYLVQYTAGAEGWNCIETDAMVFYSLNYSYKLWHQAHGRIDRLNTPFKKLYYYVLMSNSAIDKAIWRSLMGKKNFNENRFVRSVLDTDSQKVAV